MRKEKYKMLAITGLLTISTGIIFYLIFTQIDLRETFSIIRQVNLRILSESILISVVLNIFVDVEIRRRIWLYMNYALSYKEAFFLRMGSMPFKVIPSFKDTGIVPALYLKKFYNMPIIEGVLSNVIANIFNLIAILLFITFGYMFYGIRTSTIDQYPLYLFIVLMLIFVVFILLYSFLINQKIGKRILFYLCFSKTSKYYTILQKNMDIWKSLPAQETTFLLVYSILFQIGELLIFFVLSKAYHLAIPFTAILLYVPLAIIISNLPVTFTGFGVREGAFVIFFLNFGTKETLFALGTVVFFVNKLVPLFVGFLLLIPFIHKLQFSKKTLEQL